MDRPRLSRLQRPLRPRSDGALIARAAFDRDLHARQVVRAPQRPHHSVLPAGPARKLRADVNCVRSADSTDRGGTGRTGAAQTGEGRLGGRGDGSDSDSNAAGRALYSVLGPRSTPNRPFAGTSHDPIRQSARRRRAADGEAYPRSEARREPPSGPGFLIPAGATDGGPCHPASVLRKAQKPRPPALLLGPRPPG